MKSQREFFFEVSLFHSLQIIFFTCVAYRTMDQVIQRCTDVTLSSQVMQMQTCIITACFKRRCVDVGSGRSSQPVRIPSSSLLSLRWTSMVAKSNIIFQVVQVVLKTSVAVGFVGLYRAQDHTFCPLSLVCPLKEEDFVFVFM